VGGILVVHLVVSLVALDTALLEVLVCLDELFVDEETQVVGLRLDRRRRPRSPLSLAFGNDEGLAGLLERCLVGVAGDTTALVLGSGRGGQKEEERKQKRNGQDRESSLHGSSRSVQAVHTIVMGP
jgi:hypothetical protein